MQTMKRGLVQAIEHPLLFKEIDMLDQLLVGTVVSICNITIHSLLMTAVVSVSRSTSKMRTSHPSLLLTCVMIATALVLMAAHICEATVWALAYRIVDAAPAGSGLINFAFVNYTDTWHGDICQSPIWCYLDR